MSANKQILIIGLRGGTDPETSRLFTAEQVKEGIQKETQALATVGFTADFYSIVETDSNIPEKVKEVINNKKRDGIAIGFGIRRRPDLTPLFEELVHLAIHETTPTPKLMFPTSPFEIMEPVKRAFPNAF